MSCPNCQCEMCRPESSIDNSIDNWLSRQNVPDDVLLDEVLFYKYQAHLSRTGRAMRSPDTRKWCGFWPDGTPLTGFDENNGEERRWWWDTKDEVLAVIREGLTPVVSEER